MSQTVSITFSGDGSFSIPIATSARSKLGKREMTGGISVAIGDIPENVLKELVIAAITAHAQVGLKSLDQDNCTQDQALAALQSRVQLLKDGKVSGTTTRKAPTQDPVRKLAKALLKKAYIDRSDEELDGRELVKIVNEDFKTFDLVVKATKKKEEVNEDDQMVHDIVASVLATARSQVDLETKLLSTLSRGKAKAAPASATKAAVADTAEAKPATAKPTPTQKVANQRKQGGQGRSA